MKIEIKDHCVSCNKETEYNKTDNTTIRIGYIEGAGQLCLGCLREIE